MKTIPPVMNARYRVEKTKVLPGYQKVLDIIREKTFMGRRLPRIPQIESMLQFWTRVSHPCFSQVFRYLDVDNEYVAIMRRLPADAQPLSEILPSKLSSEMLGRILLHLVHALHFMHDHEINHPNLDLSKIYSSEKQPIIILGHEGSLSSQALRMEEQLASFDIRYAAPEALSRGGPSPKSDIYFLGALIYHFLMGKTVRPGEPIDEVTYTYRRLRKDWDHLLKAMVEKDPLDRPDWAEVRRRVRKLSGKTVTVSPAWLGMEDKKTIKVLKGHILESRKKPQAVALQVHPGREMVRRLTALTQWAEEQNFLVFHTWISEKETQHYSSINDILLLLKEGVVKHMNRPDLFSELMPLSDWHAADDLIDKWRQLLRQVFRAMVPEYCDGVVLIIEDFLHMDKASLETLINLFSWLGGFPFTLLITGDVFAHGHLTTLHKRWPFDWSYLHPAPLDEKQLDNMIWYGEDDQETSVNMAEVVNETRGEEVMTYYILEEKVLKPDVFKNFLDKTWRCLPLKERQLLKIISCSERPLSALDMERAFEVPDANRSLEVLALYRHLEKKNDGFHFYFPAIQRFIRRRISHQDRRVIIDKLFEYECLRANSDMVQCAFLKGTLENSEGSVRFLYPIIQQAQIHFNLNPIWRIERCYKNSKTKGFQEVATLAECIRGAYVPISLTRDNEINCKLNQCNRYLAKGSYEKALLHFRRFSGNRKIGTGFKAFLTMKTSELASICNDKFAASKAWRKFVKLNLNGIEEKAREELITRMVVASKRVDSLLIHEKRMVANIDSKLKAWIEADEAYRNNDFKKAVVLITTALKRLRNHYDLNWRGDIYMLHGKALHRTNRPMEAIWAYKKAYACYEASRNKSKMEAIHFNMACAHHLAGSFSLADKTFRELEQKYSEADDMKGQSGAVFYLMASAIFLHDLNLYESYYKTHRLLTRKVKLSAERLTGLTLRLHDSFSHTKEEILDNIWEMNNLIQRVKPNHLLLDEAEVALRIGYFALGKPVDPPAHPYPEWTAWRHDFIDLLIGGEQKTLPDMVKQLGDGYLQAIHLFLLRRAIEAKMIPKKFFSEYLLEVFEDYGRSQGANLGGFLKKHFSHLRTLGNVPRETWQSAIGIFESISWTRPDHKSLKSKIIEGLREVWPFSKWGVYSLDKKDKWARLLGEENPDVENLLGNMNLNELEDSLVSTYVSGDAKETQSVLFLPITLSNTRCPLIWLLNERAVDHDFETHYEPLFRFYAKMFEFLFGRILEEEESIAEEPQETVDKSFGIIGKSHAITVALNDINQYGPSDLNIFIWGESGTGKELAAKAIHLASDRSNKPFRAINCAHYSDTMVEAELFGHCKGSFTGANSDKAGILELVDGGTLFLDEIGDINVKTQSLLLRVIQQGEFSRVGDGETRKVDLRFVTATNKDLDELIKRGEFRSDLYYRLVHQRIDLPPLRNRLEDLKLLTEHFKSKYEPDKIMEFRDDFFEMLAQHSWPGNIRELESYIRKIMVKWRDRDYITAKQRLPFNNVMEEILVAGDDSMTLEAYDRKSRATFINQRLTDFVGNRTKAAESLGISRQQLSNLITRYGIDKN